MRMHIVLSAFLLTLGACQNKELFSFDVQEDQQNLKGGRLVNENELIAKAVAGVTVISNDPINPQLEHLHSFGTGVIVAPDIILTSAHTFRGQKLGWGTNPNGTQSERRIELRFGTKVNYPQNIVVTPSDFSNPSVFDSNYEGPDFVYIHLAKGVPFQSAHMLIWNPDNSNDFGVNPGDYVNIAGYGINSNNTLDLTLRVGRVKVTATDIRNAQFAIPDIYKSGERKIWFESFFLETNQTESDAYCFGDSGAPLYHEIVKNGVPRFRLLSIHLASGHGQNGSCLRGGYSLRTGAFHQAGFDFVKKLRR